VTQRTINRITYVGKQKNKNKNMINKRKEHLEWCKKRAMEYIERGESMESNEGIPLFCLVCKCSGHLSRSNEIEKFINGFNSKYKKSFNAMTRHSKVFVPVKYRKIHLDTAYSSKEKEWLLMEEKENVYVLSERELFELMQQYQAQVYYANNITPEE
jgi:hypothetical protein